MRLRRPDSLAHFLADASPLLVQHEPEHGLILSVAGEAARAPAQPDGAYWAIVVDGHAPVAAALRTAEKLILSRVDSPDAATLLARDAMRHLPTAVLGPHRSVAMFAAAATAWDATVLWREGMAQRIYECRGVVPPAQPSGAARPATLADRDGLVEWTCAFQSEAVGRVPDVALVTATLDRRIATGALYVWDVDGAPASMCVALGPTPRGIRISGVYTPPARRGRGYASALVAAVTRSLLDDGRAFTYLYTDLANPTSNAIYQKIGYVPVANVRELWRVIS
jgi:uncharacterized protein